MRYTSALLGLLAVVQVRGSAALHKQEPAYEEGSVVPGAFIVEFADDDDTTNFYGGLGVEGIRVEHRLDLKHKLFKGASFTIKDHAEPEVSAKGNSKSWCWG